GLGIRKCSSWGSSFAKFACAVQHPVDECYAGKTLSCRFGSSATAMTVATMVEIRGLLECTSSLVARLRHSKIADGLPLSGEERSCSGHHSKTEFGPICDIGHQFCCTTRHSLLRSHETPRVHHAHRRRGGRVAAHGARAAGRANAADRVLVRRRESSRCSPYFRPLVLVFFMA